MLVKSSIITAFSVAFVALLLSPSIVSVVAYSSGSQSFTPFGATTVVHLIPARGDVGRKVQINAQRFPASTPYTIKFGNVVVGTGKVSTTGTFSTNIIVPQSPDGANVVTVTAGKTVVTREFNVIPSIIISPKTGGFGTVIKVTGHGFAVNSAVTVWEGSSSYVLVTTTGSTTVNANSSGSFVGFYPTKPFAPGKYTVTATDASGNSASATFTVPK